MIRLYDVLNDPVAYKKLLRYVRKYNISAYNRYNQIKASVHDTRYKLGYRTPWMDTMLDIAWDYKKTFLDTRTKQEIALWLLEDNK